MRAGDGRVAALPSLVRAYLAARMLRGCLLRPPAVAPQRRHEGARHGSESSSRCHTRTVRRQPASVNVSRLERLTYGTVSCDRERMSNRKPDHVNAVAWMSGLSVNGAAARPLPTAHLTGPAEPVVAAPAARLANVRAGIEQAMAMAKDAGGEQERSLTELLQALHDLATGVTR